MGYLRGIAGKPEPTLRIISEAAKSGWGNKKHATYSISLESSMLNTGSFSRDGKVDGKEGRGPTPS